MTFTLHPEVEDRIPELPDKTERLVQHAAWFIKMRWLASAAILVAILVARTGRMLDPSALPLLAAWWLLLVAANAFFRSWLKRGAEPARHIMLQAVLDLVILTGLLNASGGFENPFYQLYALHVIIVAILLPEPACRMITLIAASLVLLLAIGELSGLAPHFTNRFFPHSSVASHDGGGEEPEEVQHAARKPSYVVGCIVPLLTLLLVSGQLTSMIARNLRRNEETLEAVARSAILDRGRLESVIHSTGLGMLLIARDMNILWVSGRAAAWLGWQARRKGHACPRRGLEGACKECLAARTIALEAPQRGEVKIEAADGKTRFFRHVTSPVRDRTGRVVQVVEVIEEITEWKAMQEQALHAGRLAALGTLAAGIAHEIGNPLASIEARLGLLDRKAEDAAFVRKSVALLRGQIERIGRIVKGVTQFARTHPLKRHPVDLNSVAREALGVARLHPAASGVAFHQELAGGDPRALGSPDQLVQVVVNILLNAVHAAGDGGRVAIRTWGDGDRCGVTVRDTGKGMPPDVLERLFDPFFTTRESGTGLGLSLCDSLVKAHGGRIVVESKGGTGSSFKVELPACKSSSEKTDGSPLG